MHLALAGVQCSHELPRALLLVTRPCSEGRRTLAVPDAAIAQCDGDEHIARLGDAAGRNREWLQQGNSQRFYGNRLNGCVWHDSSKELFDNGKRVPLHHDPMETQ